MARSRRGPTNDTAWEQRMLAGLARRNARFELRIRSFADNADRLVRMTMNQRLRLAVQLLRDKIVINLSRPVRKYVVRRTITDQSTGRKRTVSKTRVDPRSRSRPGEFPRADTTRLMKDIFFEVDEQNGVGYVGTTLDYGLYLETRMDRSFLRRTLTEMESTLVSILGARFTS